MQDSLARTALVTIVAGLANFIRCALVVIVTGEVIGVAANIELESAPLRIVDRLFDDENPTTLGLEAIPGDHTVVYRATEGNFTFSHQQNIGAFDGKLYLMWSNGITHEDHNGQRVLYAFSEDGVHWSEPALLAPDHDGPGPLTNVAAGFHGSGDQLVAYYSAFPEGREGSDDRNNLFYLTSTDGEKWSRPRKLARGWFIEGPRRLPGGRLLMNGQCPTGGQPRLRYTNAADGITGWRDAEIPVVEGVFAFPEPSWYVRDNNSEIVMVFRQETGPLSQRTIHASVSRDNGESWTKPVKTNFPDATARAFAGNLPDGTAFIISNPSRFPSSTHPTYGRRIPLTIALSEDGVVFDRAYTIRTELTSMRFKGKNKADGWQYPTAVVWGDHLYIAYSINKEDEGVTRVLLRDL